jgi:hypothetical protein
MDNPEGFAFLFTLIPPGWLPWIALGFAALYSVRGVLVAFERGAHELDIVLDGKVDWLWVGQVSDFARKLDNVIAKLDVIRMLIEAAKVKSAKRGAK